MLLNINTQVPTFIITIKKTVTMMNYIYINMFMFMLLNNHFKSLQPIIVSLI